MIYSNALETMFARILYLYAQTVEATTNVAVADVAINVNDGFFGAFSMAELFIFLVLPTNIKRQGYRSNEELMVIICLLGTLWVYL